MSILIKGMEMPNDGKEWIMLLRVAKGEVELFDPIGEDESVFYEAVELPPHGDLIERDVLYQSIKDSIDECHKWAEEVEGGEMYARVSQALGTFVECALRVKNAPTVVPAEGKEET